MDIFYKKKHSHVEHQQAVEEVVKPDLIRASNTQTAKVSLDDCLACSGCVTSAETVLITQQSTGKLKEAVASGRRENRELVCTLCNPKSAL